MSVIVVLQGGKIFFPLSYVGFDTWKLSLEVLALKELAFRLLFPKMRNFIQCMGF